VTWTGWDESRPSVSSLLDDTGTPRRCMLAWENRTVGSTAGFLRIEGREGSTIVGAVNLGNVHLGTAYDYSRTSVTSDGYEFLFAYSKEIVANGGQRDVYVRRARIPSSAQGLTLDPGIEPLASTSDSEDSVCLASMRASGAADARLFAAWDVSVGAQHDVGGALYVNQTSIPVETFCLATAADCPCGNNGNGGGGCENSAATGGARLDHLSGIARISNDTLKLRVISLPQSTSCLLFQSSTLIGDGTTGTANPFGDGLRCIAPPTVRLYLQQTSNGYVSYPPAGGTPLSVVGQIAAYGGPTYYQAWYRDPASFCTAGTTNLTNALEVVWTP
jgi:hypothetical protein